MFFDRIDAGQEEEAAAAPRLAIPVPFLRHPIGAGDVAKAAIQAVTGAEPCETCEERRQRMNRRVVFNPWAT